jgi:hypothetical protein
MLLASLAFLIAAWGCDGGSAPRTITPEARQALEKRKVDVQPGAGKDRKVKRKTGSIQFAAPPTFIAWRSPL